jgi:hypothetical protein
MTFARQMKRIKIAGIVTSACSVCAWTFSPSGAPRGRNLEEMIENYERECEEEFASHICVEHPRSKDARDSSK